MVKLIDLELSSDDYVDVCRDGGVLKRVKSAGDEAGGSPPGGSACKVRFTGCLPDGTVFDSSRPSGFVFNVGEREAIKAGDKAEATMRRGEKCEVVCRCDYAYGKEGRPPRIPAARGLEEAIKRGCRCGWD